MADDIKVSPTPIQRNRRDIGIELLRLYLERGNYVTNEITEDKIADLYKKYYKVAVESELGR
ncbi:hypothetical protein [Clostridium botulinum]|uniref:hypothetical protein n=1 Tax=Clostridium botulinum TaxID=1491 RepID=UPI001C9A5A6B|nr:hypothetical protein [Clostridium botulinum]MBY6900398.1 hypothetical protein [Clostridium botulinum]MBY6914675.1 hypothetical protein [Clostridium botulinum]